MKNMLTISIALAVTLCLNSPARAATIVDVHRDGYVEDFSLDQAVPLDGTADAILDTNALIAGQGEFFDEFNSFRFDDRAIMTFDIDAYSGQTLTSAYLTGYGTRVDNQGSFDPITGRFYLYSGDGLLGLDDFDSAAAFLGDESFAADPQGFDLELFELDVTSHLQNLLNDPTAHFAEFRVESDSPSVFINAGETDGTHSVDPRWPGPKLALNFEPVAAVPEPSSLLLLSFGTGLMAFLRRKKNKA